MDSSLHHIGVHGHTSLLYRVGQSIFIRIVPFTSFIWTKLLFSVCVQTFGKPSSLSFFATFGILVGLRLPRALSTPLAKVKGYASNTRIISLGIDSNTNISGL